MSPRLSRGHTRPGNAQEGKQTFKTHFFRPYLDSEWPWRHTGVAVRPKITTPPRTGKCLPWGGGGVREGGGVGGGGSSPKYTCLLGYRLCLKRSEKKQAASSSHCASFKQDSVYCFSLCCISNNSGVDGRQQERESVCVCVSDSGAQRRNIWAFYLLCSLLFIFSALWWTWTVTCEDLCKCRGQRLLTWRVPLTFNREGNIPGSSVR